MVPAHLMAGVRWLGHSRAGDHGGSELGRGIRSRAVAGHTTHLNAFPADDLHWCCTAGPITPGRVPMVRARRVDLGLLHPGDRVLARPAHSTRRADVGPRTAERAALSDSPGIRTKRN